MRESKLNKRRKNLRKLPEQRRIKKFQKKQVQRQERDKKLENENKPKR